MKNWKTIKSKVVFKCPYFKVLEEDFSFQNGENMHKYFILKSNDYVVVIPKEEDFLYLISFYRYTTKSQTFEFIAGHKEKNESCLQAAKKELKEEGGIKAGTIKKIGWYYAYKGRSDQKAHIFLAENLEFGEQCLESLEKDGDLTVRRFKIDEIGKLIKRGRIKDVDTIASFNLLNIYLSEKEKRNIVKISC